MSPWLADFQTFGGTQGMTFENRPITPPTQLESASEAHAPNWGNDLHVQKSKNGGVSLSDSDGKLDFDAGGRIAAITSLDPAHSGMTRFDHGKILTVDDAFPGGARDKWTFSNGHLSRFDVMTANGQSRSLEFLPDGTALLDGNPVQNHILDANLGPNIKQRFVFDDDHKLARTIYKGPDAFDTTKYKNGVPTVEVGMDAKTHTPTYAKFDKSGQMVAMGTVSDEGKTEIDLDSGRIVKVLNEPSPRSALLQQISEPLTPEAVERTRRLLQGADLGSPAT
jgi:hypothetical protein